MSYFKRIRIFMLFGMLLFFSNFSVLSTAYDPDVEKDIRQLRTHAHVVSNPLLRAAILDALMNLQQVSKITREDTKQGSTICKYYVEESLPKTYEIGYSKNSQGTLLHELVHVSVNHYFLQDFVNYKSPIKTNPVKPTYSSDGVRTNEQARQAKWMDNSKNSERITKMQLISAKAAACTLLKSDVKSYIIDKCNYAITNPHIEFSSTIAQLAYYAFLQGLPVKGADSSSAENSLYNTIYDVLEFDLKQRQVAPACNLK